MIFVILFFNIHIFLFALPSFTSFSTTPIKKYFIFYWSIHFTYFFLLTSQIPCNILPLLLSPSRYIHFYLRSRFSPLTPSLHTSNSFFLISATPTLLLLLYSLLFLTFYLFLPFFTSFFQFFLPTLSLYFIPHFSQLTLHVFIFPLLQIVF